MTRASFLGVIALGMGATGCGSSNSPSWPSAAEQQTEITSLVSNSIGTSLQVQSVDWCVDGTSSNEYECRLEMTGVGGDPNTQQVTYWMKCDAAAQTCRMENGY